MTVLKRASKRDLPRFVSIFISGFAKSGIHHTKAVAQKRLSKLLRTDPKTCFAIYSQKKIAGLLFAQEYFWGTDKCLFIAELVIHPLHQHEGIGSKALQLVSNWAIRHQYDILELVAQKKKKLQFFYRKNQFKESGYAWLRKKLRKK